MDHFLRLLKFHRHCFIINYFGDNYRFGNGFLSWRDTSDGEAGEAPKIEIRQHDDVDGVFQKQEADFMTQLSLMSVHKNSACEERRNIILIDETLKHAK